MPAYTAAPHPTVTLNLFQGPSCKIAPRKLWRAWLP